MASGATGTITFSSLILKKYQTLNIKIVFYFRSELNKNTERLLLLREIFFKDLTTESSQFSM